jgi:hypothetical protein
MAAGACVWACGGAQVVVDVEERIRAGDGGMASGLGRRDTGCGMTQWQFTRFGQDAGSFWALPTRPKDQSERPWIPKRDRWTNVPQRDRYANVPGQTFEGSGQVLYRRIHFLSLWRFPCNFGSLFPRSPSSGI